MAKEIHSISVHAAKLMIERGLAQRLSSVYSNNLTHLTTNTGVYNRIPILVHIKELSDIDIDKSCVKEYLKSNSRVTQE